MVDSEIKLKVAEAIQDDVNKGIVRLDSNFIHQLGIKPGDIVQVEGQRSTVAIIDRAYPGDIGLNIIRMDGITRRNAKASIGEYVKLKKVIVKPAVKVSIAPSQKGIMIRAPPTMFKQGLLGKPVIKGDIVTLGGPRRRRTGIANGNPFAPMGGDFLSMMDESIGGFGLSDLKFLVVDVTPAKMPVVIGPDTEINYNPEAVELKDEPVLEVTYEDVGGLTEEVTKIRELVELPLKHPEIFAQLGIEPPKGILLHGPPGTGKTLLAKAVANETNSNFILINGPEIMSKFYGESEANLRKKFEDAEKNAPSIIFIDEIDAIATSREEAKGEVERRVVAQLLTIMDGLKSRGKVVVIAATNMPNALDPALRRPGRFDRELEISPPSKEGRLNILKIHTRGMPLMGTFYPKTFKLVFENELKKRIKDMGKADTPAEQAQLKSAESLLTVFEQNRFDFDELCKALNTLDRDQHVFNSKDPAKKILDIVKKATELHAQFSQLFALDKDLSILVKVQQAGMDADLEEIASNTHGFVGADLSALSKETAMVVLRKVLPDIALDKEEAIPQDILDKLKLRKEDFEEALKVVRPSALREVLIEVPNVHWDDVGGLKDVKQNLIEAVEWPLKMPEAFTRMGVRPPKGILLYGPPGTGKTMLAKAVAKESKANFISVKGPELLSKWVNETPMLVKKLFAKARTVAPAIIFIDEIDSIAPSRQAADGKYSQGMTAVETILTEMDGVESFNQVVVIAATNRPDIIDSALLRPGRFDRILLVNVPDEETRKKIFELHTKKIPLESDINIAELAKKTQGYVGADIESVCREAAIGALRKDMAVKKVTKADFDAALKIVRPSVSAEIEKMYSQIQDQFRMARSKEMEKSQANYFG